MSRRMINLVTIATVPENECMTEHANQRASGPAAALQPTVLLRTTNCTGIVRERGG